MVLCSNLAENEIDFFIFANKNGDLNVKGWEFWIKVQFRILVFTSWIAW